MSLSILQYAYILLFLLTLVYLFRWILELRFHLQFGRVGFFSITDIRYYHGGRSSSEHAKWSIAIGKIKTRLKRPSSLSSTAWVTIHLTNVHVAVSDLASLRREKGHRRRPTSMLNRRLSTMGDSLRRIPWWYSLSIVKYILKFTSALPAQFLMAGLANYVDVQLDGLTLGIGNAGTLRIEDINFSSVLFAAVARQPQPPPPSIIEQPATSDSASGTEHEQFSFHSRHQRHSLKRAEHLFKEKYFEISVQIGHVALLSAQHKQIITLPMGSRLAISCHLSAGFLTLKDVNVNVQIDAVQIRLDQLLRLRTDTSSVTQNYDTRFDANGDTANSNKKWNHIRLMRTVNLAISDAALISEAADGIYTSFRLHSTAINIAANKIGRSRLQTQTYSIQGAVDQISWSIFNRKPETATDCLEILRIPRIRLGGSFSDAVLIEPQMQHLEDNLNGRFLKLSFAIHSPKIVFDTEKRYLLDGLKDLGRQSQQHRVSKQRSPEMRFTKALPKINVVLSIEALSIKHYDNSARKSGEQTLMTLKCSSILFDFSGEYVEHVIRKGSAPATPLTSPLLSPSSFDGSIDFARADKDEGLRKRHSMKAWTKLFRRSWRSTRYDTSIADDTSTRWSYNICIRFSMDNISGRYKVGDAVSDVTLASVEGFEAIAGTRLDPDPSSSNVLVPLVWKWETHYNELDMRITGPNIKVDDNLISAMQCWKGLSSKSIASNSSPPYLEKMKFLKSNFTITALQLTLEGLDRGLKGSREVPEGYMDNAPARDITASMLIAVEETSFGFSGVQAVAPRPYLRHVPVDEPLREKEILGSEEGNSEQVPDSKGNVTRIGRLHAIMRYLTVSNIFNSESHKDGKDLMLWCSRVNMSTDICTKDDQITVSPAIVAKKFGVCYALKHHYGCLLIVNKLQEIRHANTSRQDIKQIEQVSRRKKLQVIQMRLQINRFDVSITLPDDTKLYLRVDGTRMQSNEEDSLKRRLCPIIFRNMTLFVVSPKQSTKWEQLIELDNVKFNLHDGAYGLETSTLLLRIPHGYQLANIVDNSVTYIKCLKSLHSRLLAGKAFTVFGSTANNGPRQLPRMRLKADAFRIHFDDDPFEVRLRLIWKAGYAEQATRIALTEAFEAKAQSVIQESPENDASRKALDSEHARSRFLSKPGSAQKQESAGHKHSSSRSSSSLADMRVSDAWQGLLEHNSSSWIKNIKNAIQKETSGYQRLREDDYQHVCTTGQLNELYDEQGNDSMDVSRLFIIETLPIPPHPALFDFTMKNMSIEFLPPTFTLDHTRKFVHDIGKGIPLDTNFSTLIPFHLEWMANETWAQIRDYPIPILLVPPAADGGKAWSLSGDYVFGDELGDIEATRRLSIPIVNTLYELDVTRTSSPPKFYSIVNIHVHTQDMSSISWSVPFQPAIQDVSRTFESFTRPPVDPSPKVGFWDKIRLMIHTRTKISFVGGGDFAFIMKGTRDPYEMGERGTGLAKVWRKDVVWLLGHDNPEREFMQIISREYAFGVPDLVNGGYNALSILPRSDARQGSLSDLTTIRQREALAPKRACSGSTISTDDSDPRFLKVALKLSEGIRMGIGCQLERTCSPGCSKCGGNDNSDQSGKCRFLHFRPHYSVRYKTPQSVQAMGDKGKDYDAFAGFRSNFIHLSISIVKLTTDKPQKVDITNAAMNSMHLTPGFIDHFVAWFRLFGGAMSYPLRNGPLFPRNDPRPTKKFGKHMSTMKYKVMVQPLTIAYFYRGDSMPDESPQNTSEHVGLKAVVSAFNVDIHQRREISNVADHKLNSKRLKANWPMHEAEVHLKSIDLRAIHAQFSTDSMSNPEIPVVSLQGSSESSDSSSIDPDLMEGTDRDPREEAELSDWIDNDDFIELHTARPSGTPTAQVLPFAYSPCIYYLKQNNRADIEKYRYLRDTHCCIMGTAVGTREMQLSFLKERSENIDIQIRKHQARLHTVQTKLAAQYDDALDAESEAIVSKTTTLFEKRNLLQQYLRELSTQSDPMNNPAYSSSTIFGRDSLVAWENLMGHFKQRYIVHNPQIIWNNSVRNVIYHFLDLQAHRRALSYYTSMRAAKFLRDLTQKYKEERSWKQNTTVLNDSDSGFDSAMAEELIQKLLSEQDTKLVAPNETEEVVEDTLPEPEAADRTTGGNVNDPHKQKSSIPDGYAMKSSYLIDLLNTQISFQSDRDPDSLVIMSNERMQVKGFNITDTNDPDADMELVKNRTIVSIENSQVFVAKKEQFDSVDLLLDNHYGGKQTDRWLAWIPLEMLIDNIKGTENFQRVAYRLASTVQYDKYNQLRFKTHPSTAFAQIHPFEDRCDSVHLNFPELALTVNSSQYNAVYEVITDLLLYKEPAKKERLARLREIMMSADRNNIYYATERIIDMQEKVRQLSSAYRQYSQNYAILDQRRLAEFKALRATLREYHEELYLGMEAFKLIQSNQRKHSAEGKTNLKFTFSGERLLWEMLTDDGVPLCECNLKNTTYILISKEDHSSSNTLEIDELHVKNTSPSPVFVDVLGPYLSAGRKVPDFSRRKMLRGYLVALAPVGGIPVVQHLELNLFPLRLQMTYEFGKALASYFFPAERRRKPVNDSPQPLPTSVVEQSPTGSGRSVSGISAGVPEGSQRPSSGHTTLNGDNRSEGYPATEDPFDPGVNENRKYDAMFGIPREKSDQDIAGGEVFQIPSTTSSGKKTLKRSKKKKSRQHLTTDDLSVMKKRASANRAFILVKIPGTKHCLSYQGPKEKNIEDLRDFVFQQPNLEYRNKTWSWYELSSTIKRDFLKAAVLHNSTALLKEKLTIRRHPKEAGSKFSDSMFSMHGNNLTVPDDASQQSRIYDYMDNISDSSDSSDDVFDEGELESDAVSMHSISLYDNQHGPPPPEEHHPTRRFLLWQRKSKKQKPVDADETSTTRSTKRLSIDSVDTSIRSGPWMTDQELAAKGRLLLGKKYHGSIIHQPPSSPKAKDDKRSNHSKSNGVKGHGS